MEMKLTFSAPDRQAWRTWLESHHDRELEVWLIYTRSNSGLPCVSYEESVEEALCFGWVDSLIQKIDARQYARKFTPRRAGSPWSETNRRRAEKCIAAGRMTPAGLVRFTPASSSPGDPPAGAEFIIPPWISTGLQENPTAWENFQRLPRSHQKRYVAWLTSGKKEETRQKNLEKARHARTQ